MIRLPSLPVIVLLALALRLVWALIFPVEPVSDPYAYAQHADNLYNHGVYGFRPDQPGAFWAVGTAAIYTGAYYIFGQGMFAVQVVNILSSLIIVWGLWDLGRRWFGETEGRIAALLFAIWPMPIQFVTILASELHFMALLVLGLMAWDRAKNMTTSGFWVFAVLSGLALAGATYVRPIALLVPAALLVAHLLKSPGTALQPFLKAALVTALIFAAVAPWSARNERVFGEPVFMSTNFWVNFWMGNHPGTDGEFTPRLPETNTMGEIQRNAYMKELALEYLRDEPVAFVTRTIRKAFRLHQRETIGVVWNEAAIVALVGATGATALKLISTGYWYVALFAALGGVVVLGRRIGWWGALLSAPAWLWLYFTAIHAIIVVGDRYHMPAVPLIALLAGVGFAALLQRHLAEPSSQPA